MPQDLSNGELFNDEETDTLGTDSGTLQTNLPRGGNPEMAAEATMETVWQLFYNT